MRKKVPDGGLTYAAAGVDVEAGARAVELMDEARSRTIASSLADVIKRRNGFAATVRIPGTDLVLLASTDGVGTKLQVATRTRRNGTVGKDIVHHGINDLLAMGPADPIGFLDYVASPKLKPEQMAEIVIGLCEALETHGWPLIGGETAEMPGTYKAGEYDLVGTIIGIVNEGDLLNPDNVRLGDHIIGIASDGLGTNGYTLARTAFFDVMGHNTRFILRIGKDGVPITVADALLLPHRCYYQSVAPIMRRGLVKSAAHITGGGIPGNLRRALPNYTKAVLDTASWHNERRPWIFDMIRNAVNQPLDDYFTTFNDGIGFALVVDKDNARLVLKLLREAGEHALDIGRVRRYYAERSGVVIRTPEGELNY